MANNSHWEISPQEDVWIPIAACSLSSTYNETFQPGSPQPMSPQTTSPQPMSPQTISPQPMSPQTISPQPMSPLFYSVTPTANFTVRLPGSASESRVAPDYASPLKDVSSAHSQHGIPQRPSPREGALAGDEARFPGAVERLPLTQEVPDPSSPAEGQDASGSIRSDYPPSPSHQDPEIRGAMASARERSDPTRTSAELDASLLPAVASSPFSPLQSATAGGCPGNQFDTAELDAVGEKVFIESRMGDTKQMRKKLKEFVDSEVKLERKEKYQVQAEFKRLQLEVLGDLNGGTPWKWDFYNCGSTYDGTKVTRMDEIDCLLCPKLPSRFLEVVLEKASLPFCFLKLKNAQDRKATKLRKELSDYICDGDFLSSAKYKEKIFDVMKKTVENNRRAQVNETKHKLKSASLPVLYAAIPRKDGQGSDDVALDLVPAIHIEGWIDMFSENLQNAAMEGFIENIKKEGFDLVTKECEKEGYEDKKHLLWRLSFSRAEKYITKHADGTLCQDKTNSESKKNPATCRKLVMRMLKRFLELFKGLNNSRRQAPDTLGLKEAAKNLLDGILFQGVDHENFKFSTFQIKTLMWTEFYVTSPGNHVWRMADKLERLRRALSEMKKMLCGTRIVSNVFLRAVDIMDGVPLAERKFFYVLFYVAEKIFSVEIKQAD